MAKNSPVTEKTEWNAKHEAWQIHGALTGLVTRFTANGLDSEPVQRAAEALSDIASEVQTEYDMANASKAKYREAVNSSVEGDGLRAEVAALRSELDALKKSKAK